MLTRALHPFLLHSPDEGGGGEGGGGEGAAQFTQEQVNALIAREKGKLQQKYGDYDDLKSKATKLDEITTASRGDIERLTGERDTLKGQQGSLTNENMRLKVALKKGLVGDKAVLAERLSGSTLEEMEKDADELLKLVGGGGTGFDGGARGGADTPRTMDQMIRAASGRH